MVDNLQAGSTVNDFVIWHDGNDNGLLQKIKITGDIISHWEYDANRVVQIHAEVQNDSHTHKFANITEKPTTLDGYGITDGVQEGDSVTLTGDVVGTGVFDSNGNVSINTTVPLPSHDHDDMYYTKVEIDTKQSQYWTSSQVQAAFLPLSGGTISGDLTVINNLTAGTITETSARKYKENITTIDNSLEILRKLNGVSYQWKDTKVHDIGFIADDVVEVLPELISFKDGEIQGMNYSKLTAVLVNGINDLAQTVKELNTKVDTLQKIIQDKGDR